MAPIRVGIIGLSATSSWAVRAHLPYLQNSSKYEITGVCNSSTESSQKAIEAHQLFKDTKAYGSVADLAANPDIDLVVCAVRVDRHYECLKPAIEAGKDCFVEWPLASNLEQATELLQLAEAKGVKTMVGLQGQMSPAIKKVKELLDSNAIGRVLSSSTNQATGMYDDVASEHYEYLNFAEFGGNMLVIAFGHLFDSVSYALGELKEISATLSIQQKDVTVKSKEGAIVRTIQRTAADHITTSGLLSTGAHSSATVRGRGPMKGEPGLIWQIEGDKGIIDIRSESAFGVSISAELKIRLQDFANGEVREIEVADDQPGAPGNIGRLYEAFAEGKGYPDWKLAVKRHAWVEAVYESARTGKKVAYV